MNIGWECSGVDACHPWQARKSSGISSSQGMFLKSSGLKPLFLLYRVSCSGQVSTCVSLSLSLYFSVSPSRFPPYFLSSSLFLCLALILSHRRLSIRQLSTAFGVECIPTTHSQWHKPDCTPCRLGTITRAVISVSQQGHKLLGLIVEAITIMSSVLFRQQQPLKTIHITSRWLLLREWISYTVSCSMSSLTC